MVAIDTNILVYAHKEQSPFHASAKRAVIRLLESGRKSAIPWPCIHEFLNVATNPRIYAASDRHLPFEFLEALFESPGLTLLGETAHHWSSLKALIVAGQVVGPKVHDARIVALCLQHGVTELWSADRDFSRFPQLKIVNPLIPV